MTQEAQPHGASSWRTLRTVVSKVDDVVSALERRNSSSPPSEGEEDDHIEIDDPDDP